MYYQISKLATLHVSTQHDKREPGWMEKHSSNVQMYVILKRVNAAESKRQEIHVKK